MGSVRLVAHTPDPERVLMDAVSECYHTEPRMAAVVKCVELGDWSTIEHVAFVWELRGFSRSCLAQLTRHRIGWGYTVESQRYVDKRDFDYVVPPSVAASSEARRRYEEVMAMLGDAYVYLRDTCGVRKEDARFLLPSAATFTATVSNNLRSLLHFLKLRLDRHAQWEIRDLATQMRDLAAPLFPQLWPAVQDTLQRTDL